MADTTNAKYCANCSCVLLQPGEEASGNRTAREEELFRQNHPPLDVELPAFRKIVEDARAALEDVDSKIFQARQLLKNLLSARQRAESHLEEAKSVLHPMRSIPNELLLEIFSRCIPEIFSDEDPDALDPKGAPWLLARVCHRWRELAVNTPQLWTHVRLDFDKHRRHISDQQCAYKLGVFTERSRGLPMVVYLGSKDSIEYHPVLPVLGASIPRWRHLLVDIPRSSLQRLSGNNFSMLRTMLLQYNDENQWHLTLDVFKSASAPVLRSLEVAAEEPWYALEHVVVPWSQITSIMSFPAFDTDALNRLRTMANLEELSVVNTGIYWHTPLHGNDVLLSKLRRLTMTENIYAPGGSKKFFSILTVPVLSELALEYRAKSVLHFPTSPLPLGNLTKLSIACDINSHVENTQHILNFFTLTHRVEWLRLYDLNMTIEFADGLNLDKITDGSPVRLPSLRFLDIHECGFAPALYSDLDPLFYMLYSRSAVAVEGKQAAEETVIPNAGMDGNGQNAATNETGMGFDPRARLDSEDHRRCLKTLRFPRWLYVHTRKEWQEAFLELTSRVELECGVTMRDTVVFPQYP
ncbi:hypothetical protein BDZ89DRAFT_1166368 [Hymenopellis radicata]|nr:hypothetical protein BDZ89DRAFT_1166368 [Hymenopellis radicata]